MPKFIDLTNKRFGRLVVVCRVEDYISPKGHHSTQWLCKCDCGKETIVVGNVLTSGRVVSCGCFLKERLYETKKKYNQYDLSGEYGVGYTTKGEEFYFDLEDYDLIKDYCWYVTTENYVASHQIHNRNKIVLMHRIIMNPHNENLYIDHIHGEESRRDNRKSNLRICTRQENNRNKRIRSDNTSGVTGVHWHKPTERWRAYIIVDKKQIHLGSFRDFDNAVIARKKAEEKYFGEYSYDNSMNMEVN